MLLVHTYIAKIYKELDQSLNIDVNNLVFNSVLDKVFNSLKLKRNNHFKRKEFLRTILLNLKIGAESKTYIAVHLNKNHYIIPDRYKKAFFTYSVVKDVIDELITNGWISLIKGSYNKAKKSGIPSRIRPMKKLEVELRNFNLDDIVVDIPDELIYLRKDVGNSRIEVNYKDTKLTKKMRADLLQYSRIRKQCSVSLQNVPLALFKLHWNEIKHFVNTNPNSLSVSKGNVSFVPIRTTFLVRKFNDTFNKGGRFYCGFESNLSSSLRPYLHFDNNPTIELDYSGMHIRMLYHLKKLNKYSDVYNIEPKNQKLRDVYKDVALISINSRKNYAVKAIRHCLANKPGKNLLPNLKDSTINNLISKFIKKHRHIQNKLFSGIGIKLQNYDSIIANDIMMHFSTKKILCFCIHDSFLVPVKYQAQLRKQMRKSYKKVMGLYPVIK